MNKELRIAYENIYGKFIGWISYSKLIKKDSEATICPICGGPVTVRVSRCTMPIILYPECKKCKTTFIARKKFHLFRGFDMLQEDAS